MSYILCERLGRIANESDRFVVKQKTKLPKDASAKPESNFVLIEAGNQSHYKIIMIGTNKAASDEMIRLRVQSEVSSLLKSSSNPSAPTTSTVKANAVKLYDVKSSDGDDLALDRNSKAKGKKRSRRDSTDSESGDSTTAVPESERKLRKRSKTSIYLDGEEDEVNGGDDDKGEGDFDDQTDNGDDDYNPSSSDSNLVHKAKSLLTEAVFSQSSTVPPPSSSSSGLSQAGNSKSSQSNGGNDKEKTMEKQQPQPMSNSSSSSTSDELVQKLQEENRILREKIVELQEENQILKDGQAPGNDETRQMINAIVKPMADQISAIATIIKKANPIYASEEGHEGKVFIGNGIYVSALEYRLINFGNPISAAQELAVCLFGRVTLQTHCLTGKASNAFLATKDQSLNWTALKST